MEKRKKAPRSITTKRRVPLPTLPKNGPKKELTEAEKKELEAKEQEIKEYLRERRARIKEDYKVPEEAIDPRLPRLPKDGK